MTEESKPLCPGCRSELAAAVAPRMACPTCAGVWLAERLLRGMLEEMNMHASSMPFTAGPEQSARPCPICTTTMDSVQLFGIPLDRCAPHGVYCDPGELEIVLRKSADAPAPPVDRSSVPDVRASMLSMSASAPTPRVDVGSVPDVREHSDTMKRALWGDSSSSRLSPRSKGLIGLLIDAIFGLAKR